MSELMTVGELAQYLRLTKRTIYRLLRSGSIPSIKVGHNWRFEKEAIDKWLHQNMEGVQARILVIDDDQIIRLLFKETLEELGHIVVTASTGAEGLDYVKRLDFDLIFLDLKMPQMDGAEIFREIRNLKPRIPVTIVTGYPDSEMMAKALEQGPFGVMNKPFNDSDIDAAVRSYLHGTQTKRHTLK